MKKVVVINHFWDLEPRVIYQINALTDSGFEVEILNWNRLESSSNDAKRNQPKAKIAWITHKAPVGTLQLLFALLPFYFKAIRALRKTDADIIHCTHLMLLPLAILVGRMKKARIVYDAYELYSLDFLEYIPIKPLRIRNFVRRTIEFIENILVSKTDCVLTINTVGDSLLRRYRMYNDNVTVLYNVAGLEPNTNHEKLQEIKEKYKDFRVVIYVGGLTKEKGLMKSLGAISIVRQRVLNVKLLLVGSLKGTCRNEVLNYLDDNQLWDSVEMIPWLPYSEMGCYLQVASVGLAPYLPERERFFLMSKGTGAKFFDYMQAGIPTVGPSYSEIGQVLKEEKSGILVDPTDEKQIAQAIIYLLENLEEAKEMGERGRRAVMEKYNWDVEKIKLLTAYKKMLEKSK